MNDVTPGEGLHDLERFWIAAMTLKRVARQGWIDRGVAAPESVADHSWGVALLAWLAACGRDDLDRDRLLLLGLVHDLPEALTGDVTPFDADRDPSGHIPPERFSEPPTFTPSESLRKRSSERHALEQMVADLPDDLRNAIVSAWQEYDEQHTPEARFVKQIDKLETLLQSRAYAAEQPETVMLSFELGARRDVRDGWLRRLAHLSEPGEGELCPVHPLTRQQSGSE